MERRMNERGKRIYNGSPRSTMRVALAHGAGAGMDTPFMNHIAVGLAEHGIRVVRFEFPYMATRRIKGTKKPPDREPVLRLAWLELIRQLGAGDLVIGGKSMGGRIASLVADEASIGGLICLGYPFHPPGKPDNLRVEHLHALRTPTLILQGERDPFGNREDVKNYRLSRSITFQWLPDGEHNFKPRKDSGRTESENWDEAVESMAEFVKKLK